MIVSQISYQPMKLQDKNIIITGASKGLGVSMAEECAREGANVVLAARSLPELQQLADRIRASGGKAEVVETDMSRPSDLEKLVAEALAAYGRIDGLINNAGVNYMKPFLEIDLKEWQRVLDVDLTGSFLLTQLTARQMQKQGNGGSIVQIASVHTHDSLAGAAPYDAAKHGMVGFSKAAAVELAPLGIRVNILSPGLCATEMWKAVVAAAPSEKECLDYWKANIPGQRLITPAEIAKCCIFLLSDDSSCIKAAVAMLTKVWAIEWAGQGIRVNAVAPGYVGTEGTVELQQQGKIDIEAIARRTPQGRLGEPEEIATSILFLASNASSHVTGQVLGVDGGWTAYGYI